MRLRLFGPPNLDARGDGTERPAPRSKMFAVLAFIAAADGGEPVAREAIVRAVWGGRATESGRQRLRQLLSAARRSFGSHVFLSGHSDTVGLSRVAVWCDAWALESAFARGDHAVVLDLYRGPLLHTFGGRLGPSWADWIDEADARYRQLACDAAWRASAEARGAGQTRRATELARRAVSLAPDDERGVRELIRLLRDAGDRSGALSEYDRFAARMRRDFGTQPAPETTAVVTFRNA